MTHTHQTNPLIEAFLKIATKDVTSDSRLKNLFHHRSQAVLEHIARDLGYAPGAFDLRSNKAGCAVSGEITLHADDLYVQFFQDPGRPELNILYRTCQNRKDYAGGRNFYFPFSALQDYPRFLDALRPLQRPSRPRLTQADLHQFTGTETYYYQPLFPKYRYTDGVKYLAEQASAYWLLTDILAMQPHLHRNPRLQDFQVWTLTVAADQTALLTCDDGDGTIAYRQQYGYTDFPLPEVKLYVCNRVLMLTSEY
jgi:hypothetical protein